MRFSRPNDILKQDFDTSTQRKKAKYSREASVSVGIFKLDHENQAGFLTFSNLGLKAEYSTMYSTFLNYAINFHSCVFIITLPQFCSIPLIEGPEEVNGNWDWPISSRFPGNGKNNIKMGMGQMSLSMSRQSLTGKFLSR